MHTIGTESRMRVTKRDGSDEDVSFDKVLRRIRVLCNGLMGVDAHSITQKVCTRIYDGVRTSELDELAAQMCASLVTEHPDYGILAARIIVSNHHKNTSPSFSETMGMLYNATDVHGKHNPLISEELWEMVQMHKEKLNSVIDYERDYLFDYFGFKTLERSYLMKVGGKTVERPQHLWMRVALGIHGTDLKDAIETYDMMSRKKFTHATPTLFNAGTRENANLASCFLMDIRDSIKGIFKTVTDCALISKVGGGIGIHIHDIRARGSHIRGTNGHGSGIIPMLRVMNSTACYVNQCFSPETIVYSKQGPKQMQNIKVGDELVTIDGSYRNVLGIARSHVSKDILVIRPTHTVEPIKVTKEHDVYTIKGVPKMMNYDLIRNRLASGKWYTPEFVPASTLSEGDFVGYPIPKEIQDVEEKDEEYFRMLGIILGDGHASKRKDCISTEFGVTLGYAKMDTFNYVSQYLTKLGIHYWTIHDEVKHTYAIKWTQNIGLLDISRDDIYDHNHEKIIPQQYQHLPESKTIALLQGLLETDGSRNGELCFFTSSKPLLYQVRYQLLRVGVLSSGYIKKINENDHHIKSIKPPYILRVPKHPKLQVCFKGNMVASTTIKYFTWNGMLWSRIRTIDVTHYEGYVYDFNMEDNHNYLTDMGLVHNSGKRNGSIALYLEPWHADIESFLDIRKNHGNEEERCRDLFTALWIPDLFMRRVQENAEWSLMCPDESQGLAAVYGEEFDALYEKYEAEGKYRKKVKAQTLWLEILKSQVETGTPYLCYKDAANKKTNQKNVGVIRSSNLCVAPETLILTDEGERTISEVAGQKVRVWNGHEWSDVIVYQTSMFSPLIRVHIRRAGEEIVRTIDCTYYHKFYRKHGVDIRAGELAPGMELLPFKVPTPDGGNVLFEPIIEGIEHTGRVDKTFCFNEPLRHMGVFNGVLTGQCSEIMEYSDETEAATCNLASIALPNYIKDGVYDFEELHRAAQILTKNINKVIDRTYYPTPETEKSNRRHRPIGIGVQGLADTYAILRMAFDSPEAAELNKKIFATIYHGAATASVAIAKKRQLWIEELEAAETTPERCAEIVKTLHRTEGEMVMNTYRGAYETFDGSPASQGLLQYDLWEAQPDPMWDWEALKKEIAVYGMRNSLLLAPMPTASTSQILGNVEAFEPITSNFFQRRTLAGEFTIINKYLVRDLIATDLWSPQMKNMILSHGGSVQNIDAIPQEIKDLYKTAWEIKQKVLIDQAADRGIYVCQSQSLNLFVEDAEFPKLTNMHFYAWKRGLKTGIYYLRTRPKAKTMAFTLDPVVKSPQKSVIQSSTTEEKECLMCSA